jgi:ABC-type branched-subunit amino acid transport system substrate-binding protein
MAISLVRLTNKLFLANLLSAFSANFYSVTAEVAPAALPTVGVILPLSGEAASYGQQFRRGMELNPEYSSFKLVFEDSKFETKTAVTAFNRLVELDHVNYLISFGGATRDIIFFSFL